MATKLIIVQFNKEGLAQANGMTLWDDIIAGLNNKFV